MSDYSNQNSQNFSQSSAFAAALQRAKQIAAKIHPGGGQPGKRSLEDDSGPESKKFGGQSDFNNANSPTGMSPAAMQAAAQAAAVAARLQINNSNNTNNSNNNNSNANGNLLLIAARVTSVHFTFTLTTHFRCSKFGYDTRIVRDLTTTS